MRYGLSLLFFQAEDGIRDIGVTGVQTCALPIFETMLEVSKDLKKKMAMGIKTPYLEYQTMFLMFFEQSTRTRNSMEAGIAQLGGHANYLDTSTMQVSHGEVAKDTAVILSRFGHGIACRNCFWGIGNKYIREMAENSRSEE